MALNSIEAVDSNRSAGVADCFAGRVDCPVVLSSSGNARTLEGTFAWGVSAR